jgi:hypothetical protein
VFFEVVHDASYFPDLFHALSVAILSLNPKLSNLRHIGCRKWNVESLGGSKW